MTTYIVGVASFYSNKIYPIRYLEVVKVDCKFDGDLGEKEATVRAISKVFRQKCLDKGGMDGWTYAKLKKTTLNDVRKPYYKIGLGITFPETLSDFNKKE